MYVQFKFLQLEPIPQTQIIAGITLHVNCKIAVFVNFQVLTMRKTDTKVKNQVLKIFSTVR